MMFLVFLFLVPFLVPPDPAPGMTRSKESARNLECVALDAGTASAHRPGTLDLPSRRGGEVDTEKVICVERFLPRGVRAPRDEAILSSLDAQVSEIVSSATAPRPDLSDRTWLVEAYYPSAEVSAKLAFAAKNALSARGLRVSDRSPRLTAGDLEVLTRMEPEVAYRSACLRYAQVGALGDHDALLALVLRDTRETTLHAGLCAGGQWMWLQ